MEKQKTGPKVKPAEEKVKNITVYRSLKEIISLGGIVRVRRLINDFLNSLQ